MRDRGAQDIVVDMVITGNANAGAVASNYRSFDRRLAAVLEDHLFPHAAGCAGGSAVEIGQVVEAACEGDVKDVAPLLRVIAVDAAIYLRPRGDMRRSLAMTWT